MWKTIKIYFKKNHLKSYAKFFPPFWYKQHMMAYSQLQEKWHETYIQVSGILQEMHRNVGLELDIKGDVPSPSPAGWTGRGGRPLLKRTGNTMSKQDGTGLWSVGAPGSGTVLDSPVHLRKSVGKGEGWHRGLGHDCTSHPATVTPSDQGSFWDELRLVHNWAEISKYSHSSSCSPVCDHLSPRTRQKSQGYRHLTN